ncbi:MAG TPA: response regulator, partial [Pseudobdellovibrionaceae bacterium]|nr:response regulator [Pseudobdellovibrionaceae bacterium]
LFKSYLTKDLLLRSLVNSIERKTCQSTLQESEALKTALLEKSLDAIIILNQNKQIVDLNASACQIFSIDKNKAQGRSLDDFFILNNNESILNLLQKPNFGKRFEGTVQSTLGNRIPVEVYSIEIQLTISPVYTVFVRDISMQKKASEELEVSKELAEIANESKSIFLANMSHEIRTPLGVVLGFSELLASTQLSENERKQYVEAIQRNGKLLHKLVEDILDISKIESGKMQLKIEKMNLKQFVDQVRHDFSPKIKAKGLAFNIVIAENIPEHLTTDFVRLLQIFYNVIGNAIKFTEKGKIELTVNCVYQDQCNIDSTTFKCDKIIFAVMDTGSGISSTEHSHLFQAFNQGRNDISLTTGAGLGLVISKRLANMMGGDVVLKDSKEGFGSLFEISIAADLSKVLGLKDLYINLEKSSMVKSPTEVDAPHRILVVEDSLDNQIILKKYLLNENYSVDVVSNGIDAVQRAFTKDYDLILMDLRMPVMGGREATIQLRNQGFRRPILALTALAFDQDREDCLKIGFSDFLSKPIDKKKLFETIHRWI